VFFFGFFLGGLIHGCLQDLCTLDLRKTREELAPLLPVPERVFTTQHWYNRYQPKHTCSVSP